MSRGSLPFRILTPCVAAVCTVFLVACGGDGGSGGQPDRAVASVTITTKEVVFRWATDRCDDTDTSDLPTHLVKAEDGSLVLFAGNAPRFYVSRGADFNSLKRDCSRPALESADRRTPESYENREWIAAVYREGSKWHAIVHNEFHDAYAATCRVGDPSPGNPCWYNSVTYAVSSDTARSFVKPGAPGHVIAPPPYVWEAPQPGTLPNMGWQFYEGYVGAVLYPTVIDHADTTINLERPSRTPHLYYVRFNRGTMSDPRYFSDRDLVRVPLTFTRLD